MPESRGLENPEREQPVAFHTDCVRPFCGKSERLLFPCAVPEGKRPSGGGGKRAYVTVAHSMLVAIYHILKDRVEFKDLSADYYN